VNQNVKCHSAKGHQDVALLTRCHTSELHQLVVAYTGHLPIGVEQSGSGLHVASAIARGAIEALCGEVSPCGPTERGKTLDDIGVSAFKYGQRFGRQAV
jgi:hypothetical protein